MKYASVGWKLFKTLSNIDVQVNLTPWIGQLWPVTSDLSLCSWGHLRSSKVTSSVSTVTVDRDMLEGWQRLRCVQVYNKNRLICNLAFSGQFMTLTLFRSIFLNYLLRSNYNSFDVSPQKNTMVAQWMSYISGGKTYDRKLFSQLHVAKSMILGQFWGHAT